MNIINRLLLAASCVTALPLGHRRHDPEAMGGLSKYLPAVGLLLGAVLAALAWCLRGAGAPPLARGAALTLAWLALTGAIHLDGWMDTADGVFSHRSRQRMLEIMRDSRVGNFGVLAGLLVVLVKFAALACASYKALLLTVLLVPTWARLCEVFAIGYFPYAREEGMGKIWHDTTRLKPDFFLAALVPLGTAAALGVRFNVWPSLTLSTVTAFCGIIAAFRIAQVLRGHTGDSYGAVVELAEAGALLLCSLFAPWWRF